MSEDAGVVRQVREAAEAVATGRWRRAGLVGAGLGMVAVGAVAGVALDRLNVGRETRRRAEREVDASSPLGTLHSAAHVVVAGDGTALYAEVDEAVAGRGAEATASPTPHPTGAAAPGPPHQTDVGRGGDADASAVPGSGGAAAPGPPHRAGVGRGGGVEGSAVPGSAGAAVPGPPHRTDDPGPVSSADAASADGAVMTVVFTHGYCLSLDCWHFQRLALRGVAGLRLVFWDQRSHGRSERSRSYLAGEPASIDELGGDLADILDELAPGGGPLVLVGHSMGGMTIMALADEHPELFRSRVAGVALLGTTAGQWRGVTLGLPALGAKAFHLVGPGLVKALGRQRELVERGRRLSSELTASIYDAFSFGRDDVDPVLARFARRILEGTPIDVVAEFFPVFAAHDKTEALGVLHGVPTLVMGGGRDRLTPPEHSEAIAAALPQAELRILPEAGHLLMLEEPDAVNAALAGLLRRAAEYAGVRPPPGPAEPADRQQPTD